MQPCAVQHYKHVKCEHEQDQPTVELTEACTRETVQFFSDGSGTKHQAVLSMYKSHVVPAACD